MDANKLNKAIDLFCKLAERSDIRTEKGILRDNTRIFRIQAGDYILDIGVGPRSYSTPPSSKGSLLGDYENVELTILYKDKDLPINPTKLTPIPPWVELFESEVTAAPYVSIDIVEEIANDLASGRYKLE